MKIGVIADVHSNQIAFRVCVDYMIKAGCEEFLLLGDFVSDTAGAKKTMEILCELMEQFPCHVLRGNREEYMTEQRKVREQEEEEKYWIANSASGNLLYTYEQLTPKDLDFFENLPITFCYEKEGYPAIICCHGSPVNTRELLQLDSERTKEVLDEIDSDYLLAAHTHYPGMMRYHGKTYMNTGSCGIAIGDPGYAHAVILESGENEWKPEFLRIPYDINQVIQDIFESGLYDMAPWFLNNNLHIFLTGTDLTPELVNLAAKLQKENEPEEKVWPHIEEKYFAKAADALKIPDYTFLRYIRPAVIEDTEKLLELYHSMIGGAAGWNEYYPGIETIESDLSRNALFVMENEKGKLMASISIDADEAVDSLKCWDEALLPGAELARLCIRKEYQNKKMARMMMAYAMNVLRKQGKKSVHILVRKGHEVAMRSYAHLGYEKVGECSLYDMQFICMERAL